MVDLPERVAVAVGETATFPLSAAWRGGYRWTATSARSRVVAVEIALDEGGSTVTAASEQLVVRGVSPGDAVVDVRLARSWERAAVDKRRIHVHVHDHDRGTRLAPP